MVCILTLAITVFVPLHSTPRASAAPTSTASRCATPGPAPAAGTTVHTTTVGATPRTYRLHVPTGYTGQSAYPLILAFHGHTEKSADFESDTGLSRLPAIVVYPDGSNGTDGRTSWQGAPYASPQAHDIDFTATILREVRTTMCVDRNRTFAVGRSNGGGLVSMLSCRLPGEFAAYAIVSGAFYDQTWSACPGGRGGTGAGPLSVIDFHGTADSVIAYHGGTRFGEHYTPVPDALAAWARRNGCAPVTMPTPVNSVTTRVEYPLCTAIGHEVVHFRVDGGGHVWPGGSLRASGGPSAKLPATQLIWQFFGRHPRSA